MASDAVVMGRVTTLPQRIVAVLTSQGPRRTLVYALGRFSRVRRAYGMVQAARQRLLGDESLVPDPVSIFPTLPIENAVRSLRDDGVFRGLRLPADHVQAINALAREGKWKSWTDGKRFSYHEVRAGRLADNSQVVIAQLPDAPENEIVQTIIRDPQIQKIVARALGYSPQHAEVRLLLSFASDVAPDVRRQSGQTIDYHFDVHHLNFIYVNYYLTDVDVHSGAHVMVPGSHIRKPLRWLFGSARQSDENIIGHYGARSELIIAGKAGDGFIQDASCYHKALGPVDRDRLMLQIRYY